MHSTSFPLTDIDHTHQYTLVRWIFLRMLGAIYLFAFASLLFQMIGLVGEQGILPAQSYLDLVYKYKHTESFALLPTLCWWLGASNEMIQACLIAGCLFSVMLILDLFPSISALMLWVLYLSMVNIGRTFLAYQWDNLLLEVGLLAIFLAPLHALPKYKRTLPSNVILWLLRWLLFRLYFFSGVVKLQSGDKAWQDFTALLYHFETQPLPTWTSWWMHQLPEILLRVGTLSMFIVELIIPLLIFTPQKIRKWAFFPMASLQVLIMLTGNYGFFNLLSFALCLLLLDDDTIIRYFPQKLSTHLPRFTGTQEALWRAPIIYMLAVIVITVSGYKTLSRFVPSSQLPPIARYVDQKTRPFRSINRYGLFAIMTKTRPEIIIEGSQDTKTWKAYTFRWKPGSLSSKPRFLTPHMPRLDWQMWFASLGAIKRNRWMLNFMRQLQKGNRDVLALLSKNPFPKHPPKYLRATVYRYTFTKLSGHTPAHLWWTRTYKRNYLPFPWLVAHNPSSQRPQQKSGR